MEANNDKLISYLEALATPRSALVSKMEKLAREDNVPIMDLVGMETLLQLLRLIKPTHISRNWSGHWVLCYTNGRSSAIYNNSDHRAR